MKRELHFAPLLPKTLWHCLLECAYQLLYERLSRLPQLFGEDETIPLLVPAQKVSVIYGVSGNIRNRKTYGTAGRKLNT